MFSDDLKNDMNAVFFEDFNDIAFFDCVEVIGYLDKNAYRWADVDSSQYIFITAYGGLSPKRNDVYEISGQSYKYVRHYQTAAFTHIVVTPAS